ncbi:hypothetical protein NQZ89_01240 [Streptococcus suis]|nr:hypothetical protein NQZ89_01240 [Streptococcus suis]HEL2576458.1 hypothetical protein [Streptococcus suis]
MGLLPYEQVENIVAYGDADLTSILAEATVSGDMIKNPFAGETNAEEANKQWMDQHTKTVVNPLGSQTIAFKNVDELGNELTDLSGYEKLSDGQDESLTTVKKKLYYIVRNQVEKLVDVVAEEQEVAATNAVYRRISTKELTIETTVISFTTRYVADPIQPYGYEK